MKLVHLLKINQFFCTRARARVCVCIYIKYIHTQPWSKILGIYIFLFVHNSFIYIISYWLST